MAKASDLESAFDAAIAEVQRSMNAGMTAIDGEPASPYLKQLSDELKVERAKAVEHGVVDPEWFRKTLRSLVEWLPETDLTLIAALGRIARSTAK